jgi:hypothetical protein
MLTMPRIVLCWSSKNARPLRIDARHRDERADAIDDQRTDQEQQALRTSAKRVASRERCCRISDGVGHDSASASLLRLLYLDFVSGGFDLAAGRFDRSLGTLGRRDALEVTARLISPDSTTFACSAPSGTTLAAFSAARSITSVFTFASSSRRTSARKSP